MATRAYPVDEFSALVSREDDEVELKTGLGHKPLQEVMVAMSNTRGGRVFIGVADDRRVVGRKRDQGSDDAIHEAALAARNVGRYWIEDAVVGEVPIIVLHVDERQDEVAQTSDGRTLWRRGGRNVPVFGQDLWNLMSSRALRRYETSDSGVSPSAVREDLAAAVAQVHEWPDRDRWPERWRERNLLHASGNLTIAGVLVLCDPSAALGAAKFHVDVRSYESDDTTSYVRRDTIAGPVQQQVQAATDWILRDIGTEMVVTGTYRHDVPRLPRRVVREVVANAVAHRDYANDRAPTVVEVRPSSVTVRSPGGLPPPVTVETLREAQAPRNHTVIDVLRRFGLAEDSGQGIDVIQDGMRYELLDEPVFQDDDGAFTVTLPLGGLASGTERAWMAEHERQGTLQPTERILLLTAMREGQITNARAREVLGVDSVEARVRLRRLRDANLLVQHGERGRAYYTLGVLGPDRSIEQILLEAAVELPLTNERARQITGLDRSTARAVLKRLVAEGRLIQRGQRRGTRYLPPRHGT